MKDYIDYMNNISVSADLHEKIIERTKQAQTQKPAQPIKIQTIRRYVLPAACAAVLVICLLTIPGVFGKPAGNEANGPSAEYRPGVTNNPECYELTFEQALGDADFGAYVSEKAPSRFSFTSAEKSVGISGDSLSVIWTDTGDNSDASIAWIISRSDAEELDKIVYAHEREKYDTSLYLPPWDESVPEKLREYFLNPVFLSEELTPDLLQARFCEADSDQRGETGTQMNFSVLFGDVLVVVSAKDAQPEQLYEMLAALNGTRESFEQEKK